MNTLNPARKRANAVILATLMALSGALSAQDFAALETIYLEPAIAANHLDAHAQKLIGVFEKAPASAEAWVALEQAMDLRGQLATPRPLYESLRKFAQEDFKRCGANADPFVDAYEQLARDFDTDPAWRKRIERWDALTACAWIGPFTEGGAPAHDDRFPPEVICDFSSGANGAFGPVQWTRLRAPDEPGRGVQLFDQARWTGGCYYVAFALVSDADREVLIRADCNSPAKVWLGGAMLCDLDRRGAEYPEVWLNATLKRGRNLLLVKLSDISSLSVVLRTPQGGLVDGLVCESPDASMPPTAISGGPAAQAKFAPRQVAALLDKTGADAKQRALLHLALAQGYAANGLDIQAAENMDAALAQMPQSPLVRLHYVAGLDGSPLFSSGDKRRIRTEMLDALLAEDTAMIPALLLRAQDYTRDDRWQDAADLLDRAVKAAPGDWRVQLARAEMFARADWDAERMDALHAARKLAPQAIPVLSALSGFWASRNSAAKQIELQKDILTLAPARRDALAALSGLLLRVGNLDEAMKNTRAWASLDPGSNYVRNRMAALHLASGRLADACAIHELLARQTARPESALADAAEACFQQGDDARGAQYLQQVLEASPAAHSARRQLQRIRGESEDFWTKYAVPFEEAQKVELTRGQFPRADSALLLDESIDYYFEDGSSIAYVHQVRKILTQGGVDARGKDRVRGELVSARTVQPDGRVLEPITYGGGQIEFPGLKIGSLVDLCWVERRGTNPWRVPGGQQFYFNDNEFSEPFAISRYVVIAPKSLPLEYFQHNLKPGEFAATSEGAMLVRTWDVRRPTHPQAEAFAPSTLETIPWVECVLARGWEAKARQVADRGLGMLSGVTALIRDKAAEITAGLETDETRARAIYAWVNEKLTTQGDAGNAHQALKALAGDREDLFAALCSAAGVKFGFAAADHAPEFREHSNTQAPGLDFAGLRGSDFDLFLFVVQGDDGNPIYLDLSARFRPFGYVGSDRSGAPLIEWRDGRSRVTRMPAIAPGGERIENRMTIHLKADGSARVEGVVAIHGERAWGGKEALRTMPQDDQRQILQRELAATLPGLDMEDYATPGLETPGAPLTREFKGAVAAMARKRGGGLALGQPVTRLGQMLSVLVGTPERNAPIVISFNYSMRDEIRVVPPEGWRFKAKPEDLVYPTAPFVVSAKYELEDGVLVIRRSLDLGPGRIEPVGYQQLTKQVRNLAQNEETRLELEKVE